MLSADGFALHRVADHQYQVAGSGECSSDQPITRFSSRAVFSYKILNSKKIFRHLHGDLNLDEIKNALRLLSINGETNLMNLIRL